MHYFVVLDLEATCQEGKKIQPQEIIELSCVILSATTFEIVDQFQKYVKPIHNSTLTKYCTDLTGITQDTVDKSEEFPTVYKQFLTFLFTSPYLAEKEWIFVTCGDWDFKTMFPEQAQLCGIKLTSRMKSWINIKKVFHKFTKVKAHGMLSMLSHYKLKLQGRHHSGLDDSINTARVLAQMLRDGWKV
jgi:inhibitor of KinA sporulation pathway (predicted exonuclease)